MLRRLCLAQRGRWGGRRHDQGPRLLYLTEIIRPNDLSMQRVYRAVEDARARTELLPTAWTLARVLTVDIVESVLTALAP